MDSSKLIDALDDLHSKRDAIDQAINALEGAIRALGGSGEMQARAVQKAVQRRSEKSNIDLAIEILSEHEPMHIEELTRMVSEAAGREVSRASLDGGISREIRERGDKSRFERPAPGIYSLRRSTGTDMFQ